MNDKICISQLEILFHKNSHKTKECWIWKNKLSPKGYGTINLKRKLIRAHRASWLIYKGDIPANMFVCHKCDCPSCVNPEHLFLGTAKDNTRDMINKGRKKKPKYFLTACAKINLETAEDIRILIKNGIPRKDIAKKYNITIHVINDIACGRTYPKERTTV